MPLYDPNRGKLNPREIYAILHVVFADNGTPTKEVLLEYHLSFGRTRRSRVRYNESLELGTRGQEEGRWILTQLAC